MAKVKVEQVIVDGWDTAEMKFPKLQEFSQVLLNKLNMVRKERNVLQVQCARMRAALEMARIKLKECEAQAEITAMERDNLQRGSEATMVHETRQECKYLHFEHQISLAEYRQDTSTRINDIRTDWDVNVLQPLLELKTDLKFKVEDEVDDTTTRREQFQQVIDREIQESADKFASDSDKIFKKEIERLKEEMERLKLMSQSAFFRIEEEFNGLFHEMNASGKRNFSVLRDFYKTVTEDDIIMILILKREVKKMRRLVQRKTAQCRKMKQQTGRLERSRARLEVSLRRTRLAMRHYETCLVTLDHVTSECDMLLRARDELSRSLTEKNLRTQQLDANAAQLKIFLSQFCDKVEIRRTQVLQPLREQLGRLHQAVADDEAMCEVALTEAEEGVRAAADEARRSTRHLTATALEPLVVHLAKACKAHDDIVQASESYFKARGLGDQLKPFQLIGFDVTQYGMGQAPLISKYL